MSTMRFWIWTCCISLIFNADIAWAEKCMVIKNQKPFAVIVIPADADIIENKTAQDMQDIFYEMTNVRLAVETDTKCKSGKNRIFVGTTLFTPDFVNAREIAALGSEGFIIRQKKSDIALVGPRGSYGVYYAAAEIFERLGARWFIPDELGACIPKLDKIEFTNIDIKQVPSFKMRWASSDTNWNLKNKANRVYSDSNLPPAFNVYPSIYHSQSRLVPSRDYFSTHPEFFALIDGKRSKRSGAKLCNSNKELPSEVAKRMAQMIKENHPDYISFSPTDFQIWCQCDECKALDEKNVPDDQKYSRRQMILYNHVAQELEKIYPEQKILIGAYNVYTWPPKDPIIKTHKNLGVIITHYYPYCSVHPVNDPQCSPNHRYIQLIEAWKKHTPDIFFYEYYLKGDWFNMPWPIVHCIKKDIPYFKQLGSMGLFTQHSPVADWGALPAHYVAAKLLWDHNADINAVLEDFYIKFYGKASEPMKNYYQLLEKQTASMSSHTGGFALDYSQHVFTPGVLADMSKYLAQAQKIADDDKVRARLDKMNLLFLYTQEMMNFIKLRQRANDANDPNQHDNLLKALKAGNELKSKIDSGRFIAITKGERFKSDMLIGRNLQQLQDAVNLNENKKQLR